MHAKIFLSIALLSIMISTKAQNFVESLYGIKLQQYKSVLDNTFDKPVQLGATDNDGMYYQYAIKNTSIILTAETTKQRPDIIWSLQLTGATSNEVVLKGLQLGASASEVERVLGKPIDSVVTYTDAIGKEYHYNKANYSIIIVEGKLNAVKITDMSAQIFGTSNLSQMPQIKDVIAILQTQDRAQIADILSPNMEIYKGNKILTFKYGLSEDLISDKSGIFKLLFDPKTGLQLIKESDIYDKSLRMDGYAAPLQVLKFNKDFPVDEIVFKYQMGKYRIWEVRYK